MNRVFTLSSGTRSHVLGSALRQPKSRALLVVGVTLAVGGLFSAFNVPLASSAASTIEVAHTSEAIPIDARSDLWSTAKESEVPLSSQQIYQPGGGSTRSVRVRALENGLEFGIQVSWVDDTKNDAVGNVPSDAAAVQLPIEPAHLPYQCMGQSTSKVNIWQWKAALEKEGIENLGATSLEAAGVRNLTSNGICKAVETAGIEPRAHSFHDGKMWHVVYKRALSRGDYGSAPLMPGTNTAVAFAVWNGARGEARGMKAVSTWNSLMFQTPESNNAGNLLTLGLVVLVSAGGIAYAMRRLAA